MKKMVLCQITKILSGLVLGCLLLLPTVFPPEVPGAENKIEKPAAEEGNEEGLAPCADLGKNDDPDKERDP